MPTCKLPRSSQEVHPHRWPPSWRKGVAEDRPGRPRSSQKPLAERFGVRPALAGSPSGTSGAMGYVWKRTRYVPLGRPRTEEDEGFLQAEEEGGKKGRVEGGCGGGTPPTRAGFPRPFLPPTPWSRRGRPGVPRAWGSRGGENAWGTWCGERGGAAVLKPFWEGPVRWEVVRGHSGRKVAGGLTQALRVFMDNASLSPGRAGWREEGGVEGAGALRWDTLPRHSPHLNPQGRVCGGG